MTASYRPHEQKQIDKALLDYKGSSYKPIEQNAIKYTGKKYRHRSTGIEYREVFVLCGLPHNPPIMAWVQPQDEDRLITIPLSLLDAI